MLWKNELQSVYVTLILNNVFFKNKIIMLLFIYFFHRLICPSDKAYNRTCCDCLSSNCVCTKNGHILTNNYITDTPQGETVSYNFIS